MNFKSNRKSQTLLDFINLLQSFGRYTFSFRDASKALAKSEEATRSAIRRLKDKGIIVSPRRCFYIIVPPEYRSTGAPPASWFIDDLMKDLNQNYYVGLLSAAAIHGASHQFPQVFQVITSKSVAQLRVGRIRLEFFIKRKINGVKTVKVKTETGYMRVSSPESTIFDLIRHFKSVGYLNNIATILTELGEIIVSERLKTAARMASIAEVQRAGYLFELIGFQTLADTLEDTLRTRRKRPKALNPEMPIDGFQINTRWRLYLNQEVEPDL